MKRALLLLTGVAVLLAVILWHQRSDGGNRPDRQLGLFGTLPILWRETDQLSDLLATDTERHWALAILEEAGAVRALDTLMPDSGRDPLRDVDLLVMAQPRPLSPQENVALDDWVRRGGRVLLFADPMLTAHSAFPLGDKRRPQDTVLLSPILRRWGLRLEFDDAQPAGERSMDGLAGPIPVNLPGSLVAADAESRCRISAEGLTARCRVGSGSALVVADAAVLEDAPASSRASALRALLHAIDSGN